MARLCPRYSKPLWLLLYIHVFSDSLILALVITAVMVFCRLLGFRPASYWRKLLHARCHVLTVVQLKILLFQDMMKHYWVTGSAMIEHHILEDWSPKTIRYFILYLLWVAKYMYLKFSKWLYVIKSTKMIYNVNLK